MARNQLEAEKNFTSSLISALSTLEETPTPEVIKTKAQQLAEMLNYTGDLEGIIGEAMIAVDSRMGQGISLIDTEAEHDEEWVFKRDDIQWWTYPLKVEGLSVSFESNRRYRWVQKSAEHLPKNSRARQFVWLKRAA